MYKAKYARTHFMFTEIVLRLASFQVLRRPAELSCFYLCTKLENVPMYCTARAMYYILYNT